MLEQKTPNIPTGTVVQSLLSKAHSYIQQAFDLKGIGDNARNATLDSITDEIESGNIDVDLVTEPTVLLKQGKKAIEEQVNESFRQCLVYALYTNRINNIELAPIIAMGHAHSAESSLVRMTAALMTARSHLTALEILINLKNKHYDGRASKAATIKHLKPSKTESTLLIKALVKSIHYNNPDLKKLRITERVDLATKRIAQTNRDYHILDIASIDDLEQAVYEASLDLTDKIKGPLARISDRLAWIRSRQANIRTDAELNTCNEALLTTYFNEGMKAALVYMLTERLADLSAETSAKFKDIKTKEQIERALSLLSRGGSLSETTATRE